MQRHLCNTSLGVPASTTPCGLSYDVHWMYLSLLTASLFAERLTNRLLLQLPRAPEAIVEEEARMRLAAEAASVAAYEADVAVLRDLRMGLRDVTTKLLMERRWRAFAEPVTPEDDPEYWHRVRNFISGRSTL